MTTYFTDPNLLQIVSNHPVHILSSSGDLSFSSFIPFCSFGEKLIGADIAGFSLPVCNIFKPRHYIDQICYEANLQDLKDNNEVMKQLEKGLLLILDYNEERQMNFDSSFNSDLPLIEEGNYDNGSVVSVYLDTIRNSVKIIHVRFICIFELFTF